MKIVVNKALAARNTSKGSLAVEFGTKKDGPEPAFIELCSFRIALEEGQYLLIGLGSQGQSRC